MGSCSREAVIGPDQWVCALAHAHLGCAGVQVPACLALLCAYTGKEERKRSREGEARRVSLVVTEMLEEKGMMFFWGGVG